MSADKQNIVYATPQIARYFESNRLRWEQFYPSERWILERLGTQEGGIRRVLDVGCAAGGLGLALQDRFPISSYVGVEINERALEVARARQSRFRVPVDFHLGDVLKMGEIPGGPFDLVVNLSCSDWNIQTNEITDACWRHVAPGGALVISLRLTDGPSINDFSKSYQHIRYDGEAQAGDERANYVVFNAREALQLFEELEPRASRLLGYGYWGAPSKTAVTPYQRLTFAVFAVTRSNRETSEIESELHLPLSLWTAGLNSKGVNP